MYILVALQYLQIRRVVNRVRFVEETLYEFWRLNTSAIQSGSSRWAFCLFEGF